MSQCEALTPWTRVFSSISHEIVRGLEVAEHLRHILDAFEPRSAGESRMKEKANHGMDKSVTRLKEYQRLHGSIGLLAICKNSTSCMSDTLDDLRTMERAIASEVNALEQALEAQHDRNSSRKRPVEEECAEERPLKRMASEKEKGRKEGE